MKIHGMKEARKFVSMNPLGSFYVERAITEDNIRGAIESEDIKDLSDEQIAELAEKMFAYLNGEMWFDVLQDLVDEV